MAVRNTQQFVTPSGNGGGLILTPSTDIKFFGPGGSPLAWGLDRTNTGGRDEIWIGDAASGTRSRGAVSLPMSPAGAFCIKERTCNAGANTVSHDDLLIFCNTAGGSITLNLPTAGDVPGQIYIIKRNASANIVTIAANGGELIDGVTTLELPWPYNNVTIWTDGTAWYTLTVSPRISQLIRDGSPAYTNTLAGGETTIATSASSYFSGKSTFFSLQYSARDANAIAEEMRCSIKLGFDAGGTTEMNEWITGQNNLHIMGTAGLRITPTRGNHTVKINCDVLSGAGTFTMDGNDTVILNCVEE